MIQYLIRKFKGSKDTTGDNVTPITEKDQCQFAQNLGDGSQRCKAKATRKWGAYWFCDKHGQR